MGGESVTAALVIFLPLVAVLIALFLLAQYRPDPSGQQGAFLILM